MGGNDAVQNSRPRRRGRTSLVLAAVLTVGMLTWQSVHLADAYRATAHKESGSCIVKLVEGVYLSGARHARLVDDLEHELAVFGAIVMPAGVREWRTHYLEAGSELEAALDNALLSAETGVKDSLEDLGTAQASVDANVGGVLDGITRGENVDDLLRRPEYLASRAGFKHALDRVVSALHNEIVDQAEAERRAELVSVLGALVLFTAAIGAWGLFLARIRRGRVALAREEARRRQTEAELMQSQKMEALGLMASGVAHDVENLVSVIRGSASTLRASEGTAGASLARIEQAAEEASGLAEALLTFSHRSPIETRSIDLGIVVEETRPLIEAALPAGIDVRVETESGVVMDADPSRIRQALLNLVLNAGDAMGEGGRLRIGVRRAGAEGAVLDVTDTGPGMSPEVMDHIFEPFYTTGEGSGLGLSIVHGVVAEHGGTISVESSPGDGTTFEITLPTVARAVDDPSPSEHCGAVVVGLPGAYLRGIVCDGLRSAGFDVYGYATADEVVGHIADDGAALAVVGVELPGLDDLRLDPVPVILLGGALHSGYAAALSEPYRVVDVVSAAKRTVRLAGVS